MTHKRWPCAALVAIALTGAGCGSGDSSNTASSPTATAQDQAVQFAQCMRDNGVAQFPDPDASGDLTIDGVVNGSSLDTESARWKAAIDACRDLQPAGFTGHTRNAQQQDEALAFAQCIREHGVKDFPDPAKGDPLVDTNRIPSTATSDGMSILNAAMRACGDHVADLVDDR